MKKFIFLLSLIPALLSCERAEKTSELRERESDSLKMVIYQKNHTITGYKESLQYIENNLDSINKRERMLILKVESGSDLKENVIDEINGNIKGINSILESNKRTINLVNLNLLSAEKENEELKGEIARLNDRLLKKEHELSELNKRLADFGAKVLMLHTVIGYLAVTNGALAETVEEETEMLYTAFYIAGSKKKLKEQGIITEQGGLIGIGSSDKLSDAFNDKPFEKIDFWETTRIPVNGSKAELVTSHPPSSYKTVMDGKKIKEIVITDPERFWSISKYLVIISD